MLVQTPVFDLVNHFHVPQHVGPGDKLVAYHAQQLGMFRRTLAFLLRVPDIVVMMALGAVVTTHFVVLHLVHGREQSSTSRARMLKEIIVLIVLTTTPQFASITFEIK